MTFMKGPLSTSIKLTKINTAENQMAIGSQVAVMAAANQANSGDCDGDGTIEPVEWRTPTTEPVPTGGGLVPLSLGISKKDPWGTEYGYCVWNYGSITTQAGTCGANMLQGNAGTAYPVVALISAGPDKTFTTTCRDFGVADANHNGTLDSGELPLVGKAAETDDDIITSYTYEEATGVSGGLWSLKAGSPGTAVINKNIETSGVANLKGGVLLPDKSLITCNDPTNAGIMAKSTSGIEICDGAGTWKTIGGGASGALSATATCAAPADAGNVRYDSVSGQPQFCNGTTWLPFSINIPGVNLVITPSQVTSMDVNGASNQDTTNCTVASGWTCGADRTFTVTNQGTSTSATVAVQLIQIVNGVSTTFSAATLSSVTNSSNFFLKTNTCTSTLGVNGTCTVVLVPKAKGNMPYTATLKINADNMPLAITSGNSTNFGCTPGGIGGGGLYVYCNPGGAPYNIIITPGNCTNTTINPVCSGTGLDSNKLSWGPTGALPATSLWDGAQNSADLMAYSVLTGQSFSSVGYCANLVYGGYDDWYLPAVYEFVNYIVPNKGYVSGISATEIGSSNDYAVSTASTNGNANQWYVDSVAGNNSDYSYNRSSALPVHCIRRDNNSYPNPSVDVTPDLVSLPPVVVFSSGTLGTSNTVTISGILQSISASIVGGTSMNIIKNGVSTGATSITGIKPGDTLAFEMLAPTTLGTKSTATITIGNKTYSWWVGYADSARVVKGFVTSGTKNGSLGGVSGADAICNSYAASSPYGLSGDWKAVLADSTTSIVSHIPWNWGTLQSVTGTTIVDGGVTDMFDGTLDDFFNITEKGLTTTSIVWTGANEYGASYSAQGGTTPYYFGNDWTSGGSSTGNYGQAGSKNSTAFNSSAGDTYNAAALRCIENIDAAIDTTPSAFTVPYNVQVTLGSRQTSSPVIISGLSSGVTTNLSVSSTGGNPTFKVNGGAEVTSAAVKNGDSLVFLMDAPATASSSYKMTITANGLLTYWRVWSGWDGNGSGIKRTFVTSIDTNSNFGGVAGADAVCQARANTQSLGGTWKAILSGVPEVEWAVNRVGYNWNELRLVDGTTTVTYAPNLWSTLLNPIIKTEASATRASANVFSATGANGVCNSTTSDLSNMLNWTLSGQCTSGVSVGNSSASSAMATAMYGPCGGVNLALFCIEQ